MNFIGFILGFIFLMIYGLGFGFLLVFAGKGELKELPIDWISKIVIALAVYMPFMRMFKPT